jgi:hypothetical protein
MITLGKWRVQDICTQPSTCAWDKQQIDSDCLCSKGKSFSVLHCYWSDYSQRWQDMLARNSAFHSQPGRKHCNYSVTNHKIYATLITWWCSVSYILYWNDKQYLCWQWLFVACCVQWWSLANPHAATQHARDSPKINVLWSISSNKLLRYHRVANYRHSHHDVMEVRMMSHFGKDDSITFFFKQNGRLS